MHDMKRLKTFTSYEDGKECFVIKGLCQYKRLSDWQGDRAFTDAMVDVRAEASINYIGVIRPSKDIEAVKRTVTSLSKQLHKPKHIVIVCDPDIIKTSNKLVDWCKFNIKIKWSVIEPVSDEEIGDLVMSRFRQYHFYAFFNAGYEINRYKFYNLDCKINDEYLRFSMIDGDEKGNGLVVSMAMYNFYWLKFDSLVSHIREKHNIIRFEDL